MQKLPAPSPIVTRQERLPLQGPHIDFDRFQMFCRDLVGYLPEIGDIDELRHHGVSGDAQEGIDIFCRTRDGRTIGIQCKQVKTFTARQVQEMVAAATYPAGEYLVMLACEATTRVHKEIAKHANWRLLDLRDISRLVREEMPPAAAERLVWRHFGESWCRDFLGRGGASEHIAYEQSNRRRFGKFTRNSLACFCFLCGILALVSTYFALIFMSHLTWQLIAFGAIPFMLSLVTSLLSLILAMHMSTRNHIWCFGLIVEIAERGEVYLSTILAHCPICDGEVSIEAAPERFGLNLLGICEKSPDQHVYSFDRTVMAGRRLSLDLLERLGRSRCERED